MIILIVALVVLGMTVFLFHIFRKDGSVSNVENRNTVKANGSCSSCMDYSTKCEQECLLDAYINKGTDLYFDDEELDRFRGKKSAEYTDDEAEEFREVMTTMKPEEVSMWNRCLILRGIEVPDQIKSELLLLLE
ncbi:MAG: hypothetical protein MJY52_01325 [Bacteroidaceae bacterium]|nr:hypothetical protein [Bacteroidaceae bacterium]